MSSKRISRRKFCREELGLDRFTSFVIAFLNVMVFAPDHLLGFMHIVVDMEEWYEDKKAALAAQDGVKDLSPQEDR